MEIHRHVELLERLQHGFAGKPLSVTYTQWDGDGEDEEVSRFQAVLARVSLTDNEFGEKDLLLEFEAGEDAWEILMEIPAEETDLALEEGGRLRIFGTEAEVVLEE